MWRTEIDLGGYVLVLLLATLSLPLAAAPLSRADHAIIMSIAESLKVPRSVADRLQIEEAGDRDTGAWGDSEKIGPVGSDGARCLGLYQLNPLFIAWFLANFYPHAPEYFNWRNPIDSAVVGLGYLAWLHARLGNWYDATCAYNAGKGNVLSGAVAREARYAGTRAYARRIVEWAGSAE
jgi:hypothetical protein